jgi:tetraacyldisaccharide 4'-kinase
VRADLERQLNRRWYGDEPVPAWQRALVPLYRLGQRIDRYWNRRRRASDLEAARIVVVGNLTAGGSGKTPLVIRLCRVLRAAGMNPGVVSRGYGRQSRDLRLVSTASDPAVVGDEPLLIARQAGVPVIVAEDRCEAARGLLQQGVGVVLSDDGLQHYRLPRRLEICVVDGARGFGNGLLLPAGPLREPLSRLESVDYVVVNGDSEAVPPEYSPVPMTLAPGLLRSLDGSQSWRLSQFAGCRVNAVAGIANPGRFFDLLSAARITVNAHPFPDHHRFTEADFEAMDPDLPVLMTSKDAVKATGLGLRNAWVLEVDAVLPSAWEAEVVARLREESP